MSTNLALTRLGLQEVSTYADHFYKSGLFKDMAAASQAFVKIQAGQEMGVAPFAAMSGIHIINGKPGAGAGIIAAAIKASPKYDYKILKHNTEICEIEFYEIIDGVKKAIGSYEFTKADAQAAGTKNMSKHPKNMLFARAISDGQKFYCPDVFMMSVYTPEELGANVTEDGEYVDMTPAKPQENIDDLLLKKNLEMISNCKTTADLTALKTGGIPLEQWTNEVKLSALNRKAQIDAQLLQEPEVKAEAERVDKVLTDGGFVKVEANAKASEQEIKEFRQAVIGAIAKEPEAIKPDAITEAEIDELDGL